MKIWSFTRIFLFTSLSLLVLSGCAKQQLVTKTNVVKQSIPNELLHCKKAVKPSVLNELDIIYAYIELYESYKECIIKLEKIKDLNERD